MFSFLPPILFYFKVNQYTYRLPQWREDFRVCLFYSNHLPHYLFSCILVLSFFEPCKTTHSHFLFRWCTCLSLWFYILLLNFRPSILDHYCSAWATVFDWKCLISPLFPPSPPLFLKDSFTQYKILGSWLISNCTLKVHFAACCHIQLLMRS